MLKIDTGTQYTMNWNKWWHTFALICIIYPAYCSAMPYIPVNETGDIDAGKHAASVCTSCHGADGNSTNSAWPKIAGLDPDYALKQLYAYQQGAEGCRQNGVMEAIIKQLSDRDLLNIVAYFGSQTMSTGVAEPEPLTLGEQIYRAGIKQRQITACMACHGPRGRGLASAKIPHIAGQHADYVVAQLKAYQSQARCTDANNMMRTLASRLTNEDMLAVANYIQGLY